MRLKSLTAFAAALALAAFAGTALAAGRAADDLAAIIKSLTVHSDDWRTIEKVRGIAWAPLPPNMLENCLPDGGCFTRNGAAMLGGQRVTVMATGARTMTGNFYFKNTGPHIGEAAMVDSLTRAGLAPSLARCPLRPNDMVHNSKWWRIKSGGAVLGYVSLTYACGAKRCEGVGYSVGPDLPGLDPGELRMYSEQCGAGGAAIGKPITSKLPHEEVARVIAAVIPAPGEPAPYSWEVMRARLPGFTWQKGPPLKYDSLTIYDDPNPMLLGSYGSTKLATREFTFRATGDAARARVFAMDENGLHPRGEEAQLLGALRAGGFSIALARCGKPYTEAKYTWYRLTSAGKRPAYLLVNERFDGAREQSGYRVYLDGALPPMKPGESSPGAPGCR